MENSLSGFIHLMSLNSLQNIYWIGDVESTNSMSEEIGPVTLCHSMSLVITLTKDCAPPLQGSLIPRIGPPHRYPKMGDWSDLTPLGSAAAWIQSTFYGAFTCGLFSTFTSITTTAAAPAAGGIAASVTSMAVGLWLWLGFWDGEKEVRKKLYWFIMVASWSVTSI